MRNILLSAVGLLALATVASAQNANVDERRGYFTVGLYLPSDVDGLDQNVGLSYSIGGNLLNRETYRVGLELRGSYNTISIDGFGGDASLNVTSVFARATSRPKDGRGAFFGAGFGFGKATISDDNVSFTDDEVRFVFDLVGGYDFSKTTFGLARYQGSSEGGYRGFSVEFGYRF